MSDASILIQIDTDDLDMLVSACPDSRRILASSSTRTILAWSVQADCPAPLVTYRGTTYIIPTPDRIIPTSTLSDLSTQTLERTRAVSMTLATDIRLANIKTRKTLLNIQAVLNARGQKFQPPIADAQLPTKSSYLPNSSRPFRADATDGVHHGWDFYTEKGTQVLAVEDGTIVHVKRDFDWSEMDHLADPTDELARQENLDVYRGNTVYLKTVSGHIAIYAHLEHIPDTLAVGQYVRSGTVLGEVGGSAVPDKKYLYHLHFELAMNPFFDAAAGTYGMSDYLVWPWWGK